jgi:YebC/PmpR family DNA-binding regulatory protein
MAMAGHSKWKQIKRKKAVTDARRGASWTKVIREITVAARAGGGDPGGNPRLRTAIDAAKAVNMPGDNIERAIKKGTGELEGASYEEVTYEGYGPGGAAVIIEATTDNSTRTVAEIRHAFSRNGGNLGATNSVAWMFDRKGQVYLDASRHEEDSTLEAALESGAEDFTRDGEQFVITTTIPAFHAVQDALRGRGFEIESAEIAMVPKTSVKIEGKQAEQMIRLVEALEELDDVSKVFSNFDIDASQLAEASS